ncbi:MAG: ABC transporter permease [Spirochaetales bacterium]|nr:ABC transporter permease [Spirochaetales bacterium]
MKLYKVAFRNVLRNKRRSILSGTAIAIAAMAITVMMSLYAGIGVDLKHNIFHFLTGHIRIRNIEYDKNEINNPLYLGIDNYAGLLSSLDKNKEIKGVEPRITFGTAIFGSYRLFMDDIKDWNQFLMKLQNGDGPVFSFLKDKYDYARGKLASRGTDVPALTEVNADSDNAVKGDLLYGINEVLTRYALYSPERFNGIPLSDSVKILAIENKSFEEIIFINRLLLDEAFSNLITQSPRAGKMVTGVGLAVNFNRDKDFMNLESYNLKGSLPRDGEEAREIVLTGGFAKKINAAIGDMVTITSKTRYQGVNGMTFKVTGIVNLPVANINSTYFFLPLDTAQRLLKMGKSVTEILILLTDENKLASGMSAVRNIVENASIKNLKIAAWDTIGFNPVWITLLSIVGYYMGLFFFLLGSTVIITTTIMVIYERMREIGTISAMGMTGKQIVRLFFIEAFFISAIASFCGVLLGSGAVIAMGSVGLDWTQSMEGVDMAMNSILKPQWSLGTTLIVFVYSTAIASLASFIPSRRAAKVEPVEALRST